MGTDRITSDPRMVDDPLLQQAVLDLFLANRAFAETFERGGALEPVVQRIDDARERVWVAQSLLGR